LEKSPANSKRYPVPKRLLSAKAGRRVKVRRLRNNPEAENTTTSPSPRRAARSCASPDANLKARRQKIADGNGELCSSNGNRRGLARTAYADETITAADFRRQWFIGVAHHYFPRSDRNSAHAQLVSNFSAVSISVSQCGEVFESSAVVSTLKIFQSGLYDADFCLRSGARKLSTVFTPN